MECHSVFSIIAENAKSIGDRTALTNENSSLSYASLLSRVDQLSDYLHHQHKISRHDPIGVCMDKSFNYVVAMLAIFKLGAVYVPIDMKYPKTRIEYMITEAKIKFVILDPTSEELGPFLSSKTMSYFTFLSIAWEQDEFVFNKHKGYESPTHQVHPDDPCYIMFTSGSTGSPKGVVVPQRGPLTFVLAAAITLRVVLPPLPFSLPEGLTRNQHNTPNSPTPTIRGSDVYGITNVAITFDLSLADLLFPLAVGGRVEVVSHELVVNSVVPWVQRMEDAGVNCMWVTPSILGLVTDLCTLPSSITNLIAFGEPLPVSLANELQNPNRKLWNWYGPTECSILATSYLCPALQTATDVPIGKPLPGYFAYILDDALTEVPSGEIGNLFIGGSCVMLGYTNQEATSRALFKHPKTGGTIYKTGDLVTQLPDGNIRYMGRVDRQIKFNGIRMELGEIENTLMSHPLVKLAVVRVGYTESSLDSLGGIQNDKQAFLASYVFLNSDLPEKEVFHTLREFLSNSLPRSMIPSKFIKLDFLPLNSHGKLDYNLLPPIFANTAIPEPVEEDVEAHYASNMEDILLDILSPMFQFPLTRNTNLLDLQANQNALSNMAQNVQLVKALNDFGITVPQTTIYEHKTIKSLALFIINSGQRNYSPVTENTSSHHISHKEASSLATRREQVQLCVRNCFENALNNQCIANDDSFFELGGTSFSAIKLTFLLWKQTGADITFSILVQNPTVDKVSEYVLASSGQSDERPHSSAQFSLRKPTTGVNIVCLQDKKSTTDPNIFLVHPAFWSSVSYLDLSSQFAGICAVYGIEGSAESTENETDLVNGLTMQSLAARYVNAVIQIQPSGPYYIAGYSFGAAVAYEMCFQMVQMGLDVGRAGLIAPPLWPKDVSPIRQFRLVIAVLRRFFDSNFHIPLKEQERTPVSAWITAVAQQMTKFLPLEPAEEYLWQMYRDANVSETLMVHYQAPTMEPQNGLVQMYLPAAEYAPFLGKIRNMWLKICPTIHEVSTSGDHNNIVHGDNAAKLVANMKENFFKK